MKKIVPFTRNIALDSTIEEITSISLDKKVEEVKDGIISGCFDLYLEYRENEISVENKKYSSQIPFDIDIDDRYCLDSITVDIDDFYYELENNNIYLHIDLLIDNLKLDDKALEREIPINISAQKVQNNSDSVDDNDNLFIETNEKIENISVPIYETFDSNKETYVTYNVHIVREDETLDSICQKYGVSKEDLGYYNDISLIKLGDKLIVPTYDK